MHQDAYCKQHPLFSMGSTACRDKYDDHQDGPENKAVGPQARGLPRCPHQGSDRRVDEVGKKSAHRKKPKVHGFITEGISYERNRRTEVPEEHVSADQDGLAVDAAWWILLLNPDHLRSG